MTSLASSALLQANRFIARTSKNKYFEACKKVFLAIVCNDMVFGSVLASLNALNGLGGGRIDFRP